MNRFVFLSLCWLILSVSWIPLQENHSGRYEGGFGGAILLRSDSTFLYEWRFDLMYSWNRGTWRSMNDTVWLDVVPVYDTLTLNTYGAAPRDSFYLSRDSIAERFNQPEPNLGHTSSQGTHPFPVDLIYENDHLYPMTPNKTPDKKSTYKFGGRSFPTYYTRVDSSGK